MASHVHSQQPLLLPRPGRAAAPFIVLGAAAKNTKAQKLFRSMGFRPTMVEMTLSVAPSPKR